MNPYNGYGRYPPAHSFRGLGNPRHVVPARFGPGYGPGYMHNAPPFYPRHGPPRWAATYPMWRNQNRNIQPNSPASTHHSPTSPVSTPPRRKGPRTPPDPPPDDQPSIESFLSPVSERPFDSQSEYNDEKLWQQKRLYHERPQQYRGNIRGRRNTLPQPTSPPYTTKFKNYRKKKMGYDGCDSNLPDTEKEPSSALNTAVQSYLLQVLTSQPPPNILPAPSTSAHFRSIYPQATQTPPPLPPTPVRLATPPPPPSDEENWDTPSEASNDATALNASSSIQEKQTNGQDNDADTVPSTVTSDINNPEVISGCNTNENTSFKIKLPLLDDRLTHRTDNAEDNVMNGQLNYTRNTLESALTIDIPTSDDMTTISNANQGENILKIVTPNNTSKDANSVHGNDIPVGISSPHKEVGQSQQVECVNGNLLQFDNGVKILPLSNRRRN